MKGLILWMTLLSMGSTLDQNKVEVYIFMHESCKITQYYTHTLNELHADFADESIVFKGLFPSPQSDTEKIKAFKEQYQIKFQLNRDFGQDLVKKFDAKVTPEVVVFDVEKQKVLYQGRIDNSYFRVGKRRTVTTTSELKEVLKLIKQDLPVNIKDQPAIGCFIPSIRKAQN
ncbi:MAG: redoxin domain-containing protein [Saprospiraceae bacterium]|nr:redoxin domain-containing protein [Saprospiraceae bacterium]